MRRVANATWEGRNAAAGDRMDYPSFALPARPPEKEEKNDNTNLYPKPRLVVVCSVELSIDLL
jgi:hypothetical protein